MPHGGGVRLRPPNAARGRALTALLVAFTVVTACGPRPPGGLPPRHIAVLSEDQVAAPMTVAAVDGELHVLFANLDTLTLQLARLDPHRNRHTLENVDAVGIYPADLAAFGVHAYAVHDGRQHVIYLDQQQADVLIPKWIYRDAGDRDWWVVTPVFDGTPRALLPQESGDPLLVTATPAGASVIEIAAVSGLGRHRPEGMGDHPRVVWPLACAGRASFVALSAGDTLAWHGDAGAAQPLLHGAGAHYAACAGGTPHVLWHVPSTSEVLFAPLTDDGLGPTTAVTLAIGTTSVYFLPHRDGFSFVIDEHVGADAGAGGGAGRHRIALIHPDDQRSQPGGYRKSVLIDAADPHGFAAAHLDGLLVIVERRSGEPAESPAGLRAVIYALP